MLVTQTAIGRIFPSVTPHASRFELRLDICCTRYSLSCVLLGPPSPPPFCPAFLIAAPRMCPSFSLMTFKYQVIDVYSDHAKKNQQNVFVHTGQKVSLQGIARSRGRWVAADPSPTVFATVEGIHFHPGQNTPTSIDVLMARVDDEHISFPLPVTKGMRGQ